MGETTEEVNLLFLCILNRILFTQDDFLNHFLIIVKVSKKVNFFILVKMFLEIGHLREGFGVFWYLCYNKTYSYPLTAGAILTMMLGLLEKLFGSANERKIRKIEHIVDEVGSFEATLSRLSDDELRAKTAFFQEELRNRPKEADPKDDYKAEQALLDVS